MHLWVGTWRVRRVGGVGRVIRGPRTWRGRGGRPGRAGRARAAASEGRGWEGRAPEVRPGRVVSMCTRARVCPDRFSLPVPPSPTLSLPAPPTSYSNPCMSHASAPTTAATLALSLSLHPPPSHTHTVTHACASRAGARGGLVEVRLARPPARARRVVQLQYA